VKPWSQAIQALIFPQISPPPPKSSPYMEPENSLPCQQQKATRSHPVRDETKRLHLIGLLFDTHFNIILSRTETMCSWCTNQVTIWTSETRGLNLDKGKKLFSLDLLWVARSPYAICTEGLFPCGPGGQCVRLTTHFHL
jgi:hypothetical protein